MMMPTSRERKDKKKWRRKQRNVKRQSKNNKNHMKLNNFNANEKFRKKRNN